MNTTRRLLASLLATFTTLLTLSAAAAAPVMAPTINEIRSDQDLNDDDEFIEIAGSPGFDMTGYSIVIIGDSSTGGSGAIDGVVDLTGAIIPADGLLLLAESTFTLTTADVVTVLNFENSDNVTFLLVDGFTGAQGDDLDTNDDGVLDVTPWTSILDLVALVEEANPPTMTEYHYGPPALCAAGPTCQSIGPDGMFVPGLVYRCPDVLGNFVIGAFLPIGTNDTPGTANDCAITGTDAGVGTDAAVGTDAGTMGTDAAAGTDAGMMGTDAAAGTDASMMGTDATPGTDAGMTGTDATPPGTDAGDLPPRRGCNCRVGAGTTDNDAPSATLTLLAFIAAFVWRRRRRSLLRN